MASKTEGVLRPLPPRGGSGTVAVAIGGGQALVVQYKNGKPVNRFEQGVDDVLHNGIAVDGQPRPPRLILTGAGRMAERRMPPGCRRVSGDPTERAKTTVGSRL